MPGLNAKRNNSLCLPRMSQWGLSYHWLFWQHCLLLWSVACGFSVRQCGDCRFSHTPLPLIFTIPFYLPRPLHPKHTFCVVYLRKWGKSTEVTMVISITVFTEYPSHFVLWAISFTPSVCLLSRRANEFFWDVAHTCRVNDMNHVLEYESGNKTNAATYVGLDFIHTKLRWA